MPNRHHKHHGDTIEDEAGSGQPVARREIIYYLQTKRPLNQVAVLPYTDVIVAFLAPPDTSGFTLGLSEKDDPSMLTAGIEALHSAGKRVLISLGGASFPSAAYAHYAKDVNALAGQIVDDWVAKYRFDGVDIDFEDSEAFYDPTTAGYSGTAFLIGLTRALASQLPPNQRIITHAPQSPYWDPKWRNAGAPYHEIWNAVGADIRWVNNQFYNNQHYDDTTTHQKDWYARIASITGATRLMFGANLYPGTSYGYLTASQLVTEVIQPLRLDFPRFGGVMGWELSYDTGGKWGRAIAQALA
jgi:chitinase